MTHGKVLILDLLAYFIIIIIIIAVVVVIIIIIIITIIVVVVTFAKAPVNIALNGIMLLILIPPPFPYATTLGISH